MGHQARKKIAVLGGGIGSLSTAFELTEEPGWQDKYEITVYQQGWRLGGKCASGRDLRPEFGHRVYEHGLHLFAGFYHHSFNLLTRAYEALERPHDSPNRTVWDAFTGLDEVTLVDQYLKPDGTVECVPWYINLEPNNLVPGEASTSPTVVELVMMMIGQLIKYQPPSGIFGGPKDVLNRHDGGLPLPKAPDEADEHAHSPLNAAFAAVKRVIDHIRDEIVEEGAELLAHIAMRTVIKQIENHLEAVQAKEKTFAEGQMIRNFLMSAFFVQTIVQGVLEDDILEKGWDAIDDEEMSRWLYRHAVVIARDYKNDPHPHARAQALIDWSPVRAIYDYVFGYLDGDPAKRALAAGTGMRGLLKLALNYRGHFFWTMRGGMGDVVIAPLYLALRKRGVKFEFFSRVTALRQDRVADQIESIEILTQAQIKHGEYQPMIDVPVAGWPRPLEAWPEEPLWDQLVNGDALRGTDFEYAREPLPVMPNRFLTRGVDFDEVVLGISVGALPVICADLAAAKPRWKNMLGAVKTTATLALQLWFTRTTDDLGCPAPGRTLTAMIEPFSTWADMTHILARETWHKEDRPLSIAYFCGQLPPDIPPDDHAKARVGALAQDWLDQNAATLWPRATPGGVGTGLDPALLYDPENGAGAARFDRQYWRANINPSDLYVMSVPGSTNARLRANESGYKNLFLCGDWTLNGLNAGAAEAATMSGVQCANAMRGNDFAILGERDF